MSTAAAAAAAVAAAPPSLNLGGPVPGGVDDWQGSVTQLMGALKHHPSFGDEDTRMRRELDHSRDMLREQSRLLEEAQVELSLADADQARAEGAAAHAEEAQEVLAHQAAVLRERDAVLCERLEEAAAELVETRSRLEQSDQAVQGLEARNAVLEQRCEALVESEAGLESEARQEAWALHAKLGAAVDALRIERRGRKDNIDELQSAEAARAVAAERCDMLERMLAAREADFNRLGEELALRGKELVREKSQSRDDREEAERRRWQLKEMEADVATLRQQLGGMEQAHAHTLQELERGHAQNLADLSHEHAEALDEQRKREVEREQSAARKAGDLAAEAVSKVRADEEGRYRRLEEERNKTKSFLEERLEQMSATHVPRAEHEAKLDEVRHVCAMQLERAKTEAAEAGRRAAARDFDKEKVRLGTEVARLTALLDEEQTRSRESSKLRQERESQADARLYELKKAHQNADDAKAEAAAATRRAEAAEGRRIELEQELAEVRKQHRAQVEQAEAAAKAAAEAVEATRTERNELRGQVERLKLTAAQRGGDANAEVSRLRDEIHKLQLEKQRLEQQIEFVQTEQEKDRKHARDALAAAAAQKKNALAKSAEAAEAVSASRGQLNTLQAKTDRATALIDRYEQVVKLEKTKVMDAEKKNAELLKQVSCWLGWWWWWWWWWCW